MILRRVMERLRKQEWTAIAIEFAIVVLGVFLGLQANNWNQAAIDHRAEAAYLSQLRGDLQRIEGAVRDQITFERFQGRVAGAVFDLIEHDGSADRSRRIGMGLSQLTMRRTLRMESPTFTDLQSSGNLEIISDPALRADIISYFFYTRRLEAVIDKNNESFVDDGWLVFVRAAGVSARPWNDQLMRMPAPDVVWRVTGALGDEIYGGPLFRSQSAQLANAPSAPSWAPVVTQLTWRAHVSAVNGSTAQRLLEATSALEARIASRVDGVRR